MTKAAAARKLAAAAAFGGGGVSVLGGALYGLLRAEAKLARRAIGEPTGGPPPDPTGWYGRGRPGPALLVALLGDSGAAGYGVGRVEETPGALIASGLAEQADRRVHLHSVAVVGAQTSDLAAQIDKILPRKPHVAVIMIGANDVTHTVLPSQSVQRLGEGVRRLREAGVAVVVGTCPDLGTVKPIATPLRQVARSWSRRLAAAQTIAVVEAGGRSVSLGSILGPEFYAAPAVLFGPDQFHPSADGYHALASVLLPSTLAALELLSDEEAAAAQSRDRVVMPVATAAVQAVRNPGTELDGTDLAGAQRGLRGRWVSLRRRVRQPQGAVESPEEHESEHLREE